MYAMAGTLLTFIGISLLLPHWSVQLYNVLHRIPPFSTIEKGGRQLYETDGKLTSEDPGFEKIRAALQREWRTYKPPSDPGFLWKIGAEITFLQRTDLGPYEGYTLLSIEKQGEHYLGNSGIVLRMIPPEAVDSLGASTESSDEQVPVSEIEMRNGPFLEAIERYKGSLVLKLSVVCFTSGLVLLGAADIL
ncbi:hypothetical protein SAMN05216559_3629 [Halomicrobium zhouii]|uniref:Uncharacterized protein n=1 Tax=Halomicrobium zhouii TaxID=767519 RepID=A0A1I6M2P4_9EURY|nr:hypothetical protein [Halomicrobium zhouii]SFS09960.1 hypothetical protein SAMN05216559_3629 [Halomicrobium zhouii]